MFDGLIANVADTERPVPRVFSNVSLETLSDALESADEDVQFNIDSAL
jgi:hypothetical protein